MRMTRQPVGLRAEENARNIFREHSISQLVTKLGFQGTEKYHWIRILTWMKSKLVAAREKTLAGSGGSWTIRLFYNLRTKIFTHYAAALLLMLCPNIEVLKYREGSRIVEDILRRNNYGLLPAIHLEKLRDVTILPTTDIGLGNTSSYMNLDILAHRLPAI
ncbi:hypothetical protein F5Y19DRAFT_490939 [Xylariaceae sp. FL1651]|nr:hypothetical protein F5Y19DRAFT_490939 [Xylariaceae sp. FL1651]